MYIFAQIFLILIVISFLLYWFVDGTSSYFNTFYGEESFLKVEKVFYFKKINSQDFFSIIFLFQYFCFIYMADYQQFNDLIAFIFVHLLVSIFAILPAVQILFYLIFKKLNDDLEYKFDPILHCLSIDDISESDIQKGEIRQIEHYKIGGKWSYSFKIVSLKNGQKHIFTDRLPFFYHFEEFFGNDFEIIYLQIGFLKGYRILKEYV